MYARYSSLKLEHGFEEAIDGFASSWKKPQLPFTSKYHILNYHVSEFCRGTGIGFGLHIKHAFSSPLIRTLTRFGSKDRLISAVIEYNSF